MPEVPMPRLSDSMEEGTVVRWLKGDGEQVARGEEIVEIETDKATMTYEADSAGVLAIVAPTGATVPVGAPIATISGGAPAATQRASASAPATASAPASSVPAAPEPAPATPRPARAPAGVSASPVARRSAAALGVALEALAGSGARSRILKADVLAAANGAAPVRAAAAPDVSAPAGKGKTTARELTRLQQTVARRMSESKATTPDFAIEVDVDMTEAVALRARLKEAVDSAPSLNDFVVKAVAVSLRAHPRVNGSYRDGRFETYERVNVGVAVASDDGLVVPTIFDADRLSLGQIAAEARRLAGRVRDGATSPPELSGGTFTVSNLGMFGVDRFAGVVNVPQAAILCVGAVAARPAVAADGAIVAREQMTLTLVSDHRILYGAHAARFLADVRAALEAPLGLLV